MSAKQKIITLLICVGILMCIPLVIYINNIDNDAKPSTVEIETDNTVVETSESEIVTEPDTETEVEVETETIPEETTQSFVDTTSTSNPTPTPETSPTPIPETTIISEPEPTPDPDPEPYARGYVIPVTQSDIDMMAKLVYLEARGESYEGQVAVAEVVINRVLSTSFPNTVSGVIYQSGQFTPAYRIPYTTATQTQYDAVYAALSGNGVLNNHRVVYFAMGSSCGSYYTTIGCHVFGCE